MRGVPADARCAEHHADPAVALCDRCGSFVCVRCHHPAVAADLCDRCREVYVSGKASREANLSLLLATLGFVAVIPGVFALFLARKELRRIDAAQAPLAGRTVADLAQTLGVFHVVMLVVLIVLGVIQLL